MDGIAAAIAQATDAAVESALRTYLERVIDALPVAQVTTIHVHRPGSREYVLFGPLCGKRITEHAAHCIEHANQGKRRAPQPSIRTGHVSA